MMNCDAVPKSELKAVSFIFCKSLDALSRDIQSPEPELLYYQSPEDQEILQHQAEGNTEVRTASSWDAGGAQHWYKILSIKFYSIQPRT